MRPGAAATLVALARAIGEPGWEDGLRALLGDASWRPDLVGAATLMLVPCPDPFVPHVWAAIRRGSWVSPQLLVAAHATDPEFWATASAWTPALFDRLSSPGASAAADALPAKQVAALLALADASPEARTWSAEVEAHPRLADMVRADIDGGGAVATHWAAGFRAARGGA